MFKLNLYNQTGKVIGKVDLDPKVFSVPPKQTVIRRALTAFLNNTRKVYAHTKTRSERRGGGIKPWRQKGTGRARAGSVRSPLFRKGGVVFGPRNSRNYKVKINQKINRLAMCMVLSDRIKEEKLIVIDKIEFGEFKTKVAEALVNAFKIVDPVLIIVGKTDLKMKKSFHNLSQAKLVTTEQLNIFDLLNYSSVLITQDTLEKLTQFCK